MEIIKLFLFIIEIARIVYFRSDSCEWVDVGFSDQMYAKKQEFS